MPNQRKNGKTLNIAWAESLRALMEIRADRNHYKQTGRHFLDVVSARDLQRKPSLAVM